ncbi:ArsR/SmtB family transcription factor [Robertmurraya andreesenii]|uniref:Transcriptional regulator n=1 Tax=Anoxybacillus andreesenii TaxID=1325932 RepID=A0ABT9V493_9BACL|nr:winged helix-turn-helix domain-containing protein [Robertmurraya andreesenii]MDQ0155761.1 putative transcriptional regulator [Robertmurraya andreesenii]
MKEEIFSGDELLKILEALSNPYRLRIVAILKEERQYVSQLARELGISRPLLYLHLQKLEQANLIVGQHEVSESGKAMKYYEVIPFHVPLTADLIMGANKTLTMPEKKS